MRSLGGDTSLLTDVVGRASSKKSITSRALSTVGSREWHVKPNQPGAD